MLNQHHPATGEAATSIDYHLLNLWVRKKQSQCEKLPVWRKKSFQLFSAIPTHSHVHTRTHDSKQTLLANIPLMLTLLKGSVRYNVAELHNKTDCVQSKGDPYAPNLWSRTNVEAPMLTQQIMDSHRCGRCNQSEKQMFIHH